MSDNLTMTFTQQDHFFMQQAIMLAKQGHYTTTPNPRVGCVLVENNKIIAQGYHEKAGKGHAEVNALAALSASSKLKTSNNKGSTLANVTAYVTLEPCSHFGRTPPCAQTLIDSGIKQVVVAMVDPDPKVSGRGIAMLEQAGVSVKVGLLETDAIALNTGFLTLIATKRPYVRCKLASSLDGKTAMANGESKWITSLEARQDVQRLRAQSCAIISGADSIMMDNARMTVRWSELGELKNYYCEKSLRQPVRVIIDSKYRLTPDLALFKEQSPVIIVRRMAGDNKINHSHSLENQQHWPHFVEQITVKNIDDHVSLPDLLLQLGQRGLNDILVESGSQLAGAFIEQNLVDELTLYQAPKLMGNSAKGLVNMNSINTLAHAKKLLISDVRMVGHDIRVTAKLK